MQFLKELKKLKGKYYLQENYAIRAIDTNTGYCPIAGVSKLHGGLPKAYVGAEKLGLSPGLRDNIIEAADSVRFTKLKLRLMQALGIKKPKAK